MIIWFFIDKMFFSGLYLILVNFFFGEGGKMSWIVFLMIEWGIFKLGFFIMVVLEDIVIFFFFRIKFLIINVFFLIILGCLDLFVSVVNIGFDWFVILKLSNFVCCLLVFVNFVICFFLIILIVIFFMYGVGLVLLVFFSFERFFWVILKKKYKYLNVEFWRVFYINIW